MDKKGYRIKWCEEESANSIRQYFSTAAVNGQGREDVGRPALFKDLSMTSVGSL